MVTSRRKSNGFVLLSVLIVTILASMVAASVLFLAKSEEMAAAAAGHGDQARAAALGGLYEAMAAAGGGEGVSGWRNDAGRFSNRLVYDDGAVRWYFTVFVPEWDSLAEFRFGIEDENGKLDLREATDEMIRALPLREEVISALPRKGAGAAEPGGLELLPQRGPQPLAPDRAGAAWQHLEELRTAGIREDLLHGSAPPAARWVQPRKGLADVPIYLGDLPEERRSAGLKRYLTVNSYDRNVDRAGEARLDLNDPEAGLGSLGLPEQVLTYVKAARENNVRIAHPAELLGAAGEFKNAAGQAQRIESGVGVEELKILLDRTTGVAAEKLEGLVNVRTAPAAVLRAIGLEEATAEAVVSARRGLSEEDESTVVWLLEQNIMDEETFKRLAPKLTTRSWQFRCYVIGFGIPSGQYCVIEAEFDTAPAVPAITFMRDLTRFGLPFAVGPDAALAAIGGIDG